MISYEITIQEIIDILMDQYNVTNEFLFWIRSKRYPVLSWTRDFVFLNVSQHFSTTSYGMWWIPIRFISEPSSFRNILIRKISHILSSQKPLSSIPYILTDDWIMIDNQQSGKYVSPNYLYIFIYNYLYIFYVIIFW